MCNKLLKLCARKNCGYKSLMKVFHIESSIRKMFRTYLERIIKWQNAWHVIIINRYPSQKPVILYKSLYTIKHNSFDKKRHDKRSRSIRRTTVCWLKKPHVFFPAFKAKIRNSIEIVLNTPPGMSGVITFYIFSYILVYGRGSQSVVRKEMFWYNFFLLLFVFNVI